MNNFVDSYLKLLKDNIQVIQHNNDITEISMPFLNRHNDYISIYAEKTNGSIKLSDGGETLSDLLLYGLDLSNITDKRKAILKTILNSYGVNLLGNEIYVISNNSNMPSKAHSLLQAMIAADDLWVLNNKNISGLFFEEVSKYFESNEIRFFGDFQLIGKSGFPYKFDFAIPASSKSPERIIKLINKPSSDKVKLAYLAFSDTIEERKHGSEQIIIFNDENTNIDRYSTTLANSNIISLGWSTREEEKFKKRLA